MLGAAALFSTGGAAIKACHLTSFQVAGVRSGIAVLAFLALVRSARRMPSPREILVGIAYASTMVLFVLANKDTTSANAIFLQGTAPLYILLFGPWLLRERITRRDVAFMLVVGAGLALFFIDEDRHQATAPHLLRGNAFALLSGVGWALTVTGLRWLGADRSGPSNPASSNPAPSNPAVGAVVAGNLIAFAFCAPWAVPIGASVISDWLVLVYLGVFQIALAYVLVTAALRRLEAFEASVLLLIEPLFNPIWAWIFQGEIPGAWALLGGAIILAATLVKTWWDGRVEARPVVH